MSLLGRSCSTWTGKICTGSGILIWAALRLKGDLALTDEETALIEKVKAEWEEKTIFDWDGNVIMEKLMKKFDENHEETE